MKSHSWWRKNLIVKKKSAEEHYSYHVILVCTERTSFFSLPLLPYIADVCICCWSGSQKQLCVIELLTWKIISKISTSAFTRTFVWLWDVTGKCDRQTFMTRKHLGASRSILFFLSLCGWKRGGTDSCHEPDNLNDAIHY